MNYYMTLGISPDANADGIRQAYLALAKRYHPDKNSSADATTMMAQINLAYETLYDSQRRKEYDLQNGIAAVQDVPAKQYDEEKEEMEQQEPSSVFGKCVRCNFVDSSGVFVCSVCGYVFDPEGRSRSKADQYDDDENSFKERDIENETAQDNLSEIIRCPQCNEINRYSRGSCWQCGLQFETEAIT